MKASLLSRFFYSNGCYPCHYGRQSVGDIFLHQWMVALLLCKVVCCRYFCYSNGWQPCHYGRQSIVEIFVTPMDGSLVIMEGSLLLRFLLLQWIISLYLWKVVCCPYLCYCNGWQPCNYGRQCVIVIFVSPVEGRVGIECGCRLSPYLLIQWMVAFLLWKVVCRRNFCCSNGWYPCHYERQSVVEIFITPMDGSLVIMDGSLLSWCLCLDGGQPRIMEGSLLW